MVRMVQQKASTKIIFTSPNFFVYTFLSCRDYFFILHYSLIVTLYSFIEKKMLQMCKYFESQQAFKVNEILGDGVAKYQKYLEHVIHIIFIEASI
jgi:hypothetical protein